MKVCWVIFDGRISSTLEYTVDDRDALKRNRLTARAPTALYRVVITFWSKSSNAPSGVIVRAPLAANTNPTV